MSQARAEILARVRTALGGGGSRAGEGHAVDRDYRRAGSLGAEERLQLLARRVEDYRARVIQVHEREGEVAAAVSRACAELGLGRLAIPPGLDRRWRPADLELVLDDGLSTRELDEVDGALTGCAAAIAETGTLVLDGGPRSGRRVLTLVPDHHICVVRADQVVELVPEAMARLAPAVRERRAPITLVSGPSASSDIELERVEGVHGPRNLVVLIARPAPEVTAS